MIVDAKKLARAGYTYLGRLYSEMDCQAFIEKCLKDCGLRINLAGSNAWYRKMTWTGTPEECKKQFGKIPEGAFLFILKQDGNEPEKYKGDGIGNAAHIGIYTGCGKGAIHSSSKMGCVVESRFAGRTIPNGGWNRVGIWNQVAYGLDVLDKVNEKKTEENQEETGMDLEKKKAKVIGGGLNLREGKGTSTVKILQIPDGTMVDVLETAGDWSRVQVPAIGWVMSKYLQICE